MLQYALRRLLLFVPVVFGVLCIVFFTVRLVPGDPATVLLGPEGTDEDRARITRLLGLDRPLPVQFGIYLWNALQGDFGRSIFLGSSVRSLVLDRLPATLELALLAMFLTVVIALPLGMIAAVRSNTLIDYGATLLALLGVSMPLFWFGVLAILVFSLRLEWLPSFGRDPGLFPAVGALFSGGSLADVWQALRHAFLPSLTLAFGAIALVARLVRSSMLEVLNLDYVRTARSKGLAERLVVNKHAFRNALLPVITVVGLQFGTLMGGAVITETIFAWPGLGRLVVNAISQRDFPVIQGSVVFIAVAVSVVNLLVDLSYAVINPKIRYG
ncbi:MAG: ABC transporter permease [Trueperaceae bacterium]|nr:MAG: ABC transporter permease [Trueperaceae bacterium]